MAAPGSALDPQLLQIVACPACHAGLVAEPDASAAQSLRCTSDECALVYPVRDGIPVLLVDEARRADG